MEPFRLREPACDLDIPLSRDLWPLCDLWLPLPWLLLSLGM